MRQYARDLASGNLGARDLAAAFVATARDRLRRVLPWPRPRPAAPPPAAATRLDLRPGERVEVRTLAEIEATLDGRRKLRGLEFAPGMEAHCGRTYRVLKRVDRIVLETTGEVRTLKDTVVLDGVNCDGLCERGCPRANQLYWREAWLKRVEDELTNR